jgi:hypothetical protein
MRGVVAHDEGPLAELVQQRSATLDIGRSATGNNKELAGLGRIRVAEHGCCHVALSAPRMGDRELRGSRRADCAHREMDAARPEPGGETLASLAAERDLAHGLVVRQDADDHLAIEQVGKIGGRFESER